MTVLLVVHVRSEQNVFIRIFHFLSLEFRVATRHICQTYHEGLNRP